MQPSETISVTALHMCQHNMAMITLKAHANKIAVIHQAESTLVQPLVTQKNLETLGYLMQTSGRKSYALISLSPDWLNLKMVTPPEGLSACEEKIYVQHQKPLSKGLLYNCTTLPETSRQRHFLLWHLHKKKMQNLLLFLKKCRIIPTAIYTTPLLIPFLLAEQRETQLFILQQENSYALGRVTKNNLSHYQNISLREETFLKTLDDLALLKNDLHSIHHVWLAIEEKNTKKMISIIEKKLNVRAASLYQMPQLPETEIPSTTLGNALLLAYWGLHEKR